MSKGNIDDARLEEIASRIEVAAAELSECGFDPQFDLDSAAALRELQQRRAQPREIICRECGLREQMGQLPPAEF